MAAHKRATDNNPTTTMEEIEGAAKKAGLLTIGMIAKKLGVSEGTVRNRLQSQKISPNAKIHPKGRGRYTYAYKPEIADKLAEFAGAVEVELLAG